MKKRAKVIVEDVEEDVEESPDSVAPSGIPAKTKAGRKSMEKSAAEIMADKAEMERRIKKIVERAKKEDVLLDSGLRRTPSGFMRTESKRDLLKETAK